MLLNQDGTYLILSVIIFAWLGGLTFFVYRAIVNYRNLVKGAKNADLGSVLENIIASQNSEKKTTEEILKKLEELNKDGAMHLQKIGLVRFNPFSETGGDQSFALAILDKNGNGFVISSLHSRDNTRIYAKPVEKSKPTSYDFSKEEKEAINKASK